MIYRQNYLDVKDYLNHKSVVMQRSPETIKRDWAHLRHLLEWADSTPFPRARLIKLPFPAYLTRLQLSNGTIKHGLSSARAFYQFALAEWPRRYRTIRPTWIDTLVPSRQIANGGQHKKRIIYTLDELTRLATIEPDTLRVQRAQAGACLLFLSGMRAGALASLPIRAIDMTSLTVEQLPELGVQTKNSKAAITYLLNIPALLDLVRAWDDLVRSELPPSALWYSNLNRDNSELVATDRAYDGRDKTIQDDLRILCDLAGIEYKSPHKLRHGHAVYALMRANDMKTWKAISQNLMHQTITTTDSIYGNLLDDDVRNVITKL